MSVADKLTRINENVPKVYEAGKVEAEAICQAKHFATVMPGSGTTSLSFHVPFEPDLLLVVGFDPTAWLTATSGAMAFIYDPKAMGFLAGATINSTGTSANPTARVAAMRHVDAEAKYARTEDGTVTLQKVSTNSSGVYAAFPQNVIYSITAVKYTDKTDKERITEMVSGLTGTGTISIRATMVNEAFTDDEWNALIATKSGWTFKLV